jgi:hypothetical protein
MRTSIRRFVAVTFVAVVALALLCGTAAFAVAAPVILPAGVSSLSNPPLPDWHWGWGNSLTPDYGISFAGGAYGVYYVVDRDAVRPMSASEATMSGSPYSRSLLTDGLSFSYKVAIQGTYDNPPLIGWPSATPEMTDPREGLWYLHLLPYSYDSATGVVTFGAQVDVPVGLDLTPPTAPTGVTLAPSSPTVINTSRVDLHWNGLDYDKLSGTAYYSIFDNGERIVSAFDGTKHSSTLPSSPPVWYDPMWPLGYDFTVEDLAAGTHEFYVTATDHASNEGPKSTSVFVTVDPDAPLITLTTPAVAGPRAFEQLTADVADAGGVQFVDWWIDSTYVGRSSAPNGTATDPAFDRYAIFASTGSMLRGAHTVAARVTDMYGRTTSAFKTMTIVGSNAQFVTRVSDSPDPFYPVIRNGYKDDSIVRFRLLRRAMVWLAIYDSSGTKVRLVTGTWRTRGWRSLKWNGRKDDGTMAPDGTYTIYVGADDGAGNVTWSAPRTTKLRSFIIRRLSRNRVRLIFK